MARFRFRLRIGMSYKRWVVEFKYIPQYHSSNNDKHLGATKSLWKMVMFASQVPELET